MTIRFALAGAALLAATPLAYAANPVGRYDVEGTNPGGGSTYSGEVDVSKTGETYKVVWTIGGTKYIGTGIGDEDFITISYTTEGQTGVALYGHTKDGWKGAWTYAGSTKLGAEIWTAK